MPSHQRPCIGQGLNKNHHNRNNRPKSISKNKKNIMQQPCPFLGTTAALVAVVVVVAVVAIGVTGTCKN